MSRRKVVIVPYDQFMRMTQDTNLKPESSRENKVKKKTSPNLEDLIESKKNPKLKKKIIKKSHPIRETLKENPIKEIAPDSSLKPSENSLQPPPPGFPNQVGGSEIKKSALFNFDSPLSKPVKKSPSISISEILKHWKE